MKFINLYFSVLQIFCGVYGTIWICTTDFGLNDIVGWERILVVLAIILYVLTFIVCNTAAGIDGIITYIIKLSNFYNTHAKRGN